MSARRSTPLLALALVLGAIAPACGATTTLPEDDAGGATMDAPPGDDAPSPPDDDAPSPPDDTTSLSDAPALPGTDAPTFAVCGRTTCALGQLCCEPRGTCYDPACLSCCMGPFPDAGADPDAGTDLCATVRCAAGFECCGFTGACEPAGCLACCRPPGPDAGPPRDGGVIAPRDAGDLCATVRCAAGFECCPLTGACFDSRCLSCCMAPVDLCATVLCAPGFDCCPSTGACYDRRCLACCRP